MGSIRIRTFLVCQALAFAFAPCLFSQGGVVGGGSLAKIARHSNRVDRRGLSTLNSGTGDPITVFNGRPPFPDGMGPVLKDTVGVGQDLTQISTTEIQESINIPRVVSYNEDSTGKLASTVFGTGVVSDTAKLTLFVRFTYDSGADKGRQVQVVFNSLNNVPLTNCAITYTLGQDYVKPGTPVTVSTHDMHFGQATFNPLTTAALATMNPIIGKNQLNFSINYDNFDGKGSLQGTFTGYVYSYLEFDAMAPVILVHGTAANHHSWEVPDSGTLIEGIAFDPAVQVDANHPGYFGYQQGPFQGVWFYYIDLGASSGGNDGILASAGELSAQLFAALNALGTRTCHILAHSKGGSDTRQMIIDQLNKGNLTYANTKDRTELENKYRILSLYTIGTPNLGTPLSSIQAEIQRVSRQSYYLNGFRSYDPDIYGMIWADASVALLDLGPRGGALMDQQVESDRLRTLWKGDKTQAATADHYYGLGGDADLNGDGIIQYHEGSYYISKEIAPPQFMLDHIYGIVGRVGSVETVRAFTIDPYGNQIPYNLLVPNLVSDTPEPNDLVTPVWSVLGPGEKPFQVPAGGFVLKTGQPTFFGNPNYNASFTFAQFLSPGDHMLLKRNENIEQIISQIQIDYSLATF